MRRRASLDKGFVISLIINLLFRIEWLILSALLLILHFVVPAIPWFVCLVPVGAWLLHGFLVTLIFRLISKYENNGPDVETPRPNKNPYSRRDG